MYRKSSEHAYPTEGSLVDSFGRKAAKLRISVTDRCNFRCDFCMPTHPIWLDHKEVLTFEEITRVASILASMGINTIRLSGGEPLVRKDIEKLVIMLTKVKGIESVSMTSNGALLKEKAAILKENGLKGVTVSLHSLKPELYHTITGTKNMFERVLAGIEESKKAGLKLKINCVVTRGCNDNEILDFAKLAHDSNAIVRFIEYMPFDGTKIWDVERVVSGREIIQKIQTAYDLLELPKEYGSTSKVYKFKDSSKGEIGTITSMTEPFCGDCDRIRLKADGKIVPCMFSLDEYDVKSLLREGASDSEIARSIRKNFWSKSPGVETMMKTNVQMIHIRPMHTIGG
ncbi:MAG: GTP 3',8-cyclase MoaA [Thaumarchaeota archaeon]|nr:GTP 3',8-cyclase MoaA [Nitrososphaerota archaeon]